MGRCALFACALVLGAGPAPADARPPARPSAGCAAATLETGRRIERAIDVGGASRTFVLDAPASLRTGEPAALLLDFHGFNHSAAAVWKVSKFRDLAEEGRFLTVYPQGERIAFHHKGDDYDGDGWEIKNEPANRDVRFVIAVLDRLEREYCIDRARVYATGFSNGAYFSHLLACTMADRIAAIAPVGGGKRPSPCEPARPVPVLIHHGRKDDIIDVADAREARDAWVQTNGCRGVERNGCERHKECRDGAVVEYCEEDLAHHWPQPATKRIWEFFRTHSIKEGFEGSKR
jgi:polyhydroxybutyrate depolymerase